MSENEKKLTENLTENSAADILVPKKRTYKKPNIQSEKLNSYGGICNGTSGSGKKAATAAPSFCRGQRLMS